MLEGSGTEGTQFIVSFTPTSYGAPLTGKLVIETSFIQWNYHIIGTHPTYEPPTTDQFKPQIDNKISQHIKQNIKQLKRISMSRNYLKENVKTLKKDSNTIKTTTHLNKTNFS